MHSPYYEPDSSSWWIDTERLSSLQTFEQDFRSSLCSTHSIRLIAENVKPFWYYVPRKIQKIYLSRRFSLCGIKQARVLSRKGSFANLLAFFLSSQRMNLMRSALANHSVDYVGSTIVPHMFLGCRCKMYSSTSRRLKSDRLPLSYKCLRSGTSNLFAAGKQNGRGSESVRLSRWSCLLYRASK